MKLEQQVCTVSQGKRLEELGVNGKSIFSVVLKKDGLVETICYNRTDGTPVSPENNAKYTHWKSVRVYTVAELGVMLPPYVESHKGAMKDTWYCGAEGDDVHFTIQETEAEARALYLIYLLENNLTTSEEVNQRLNA